jgi:tetratricopeptide (TPR) repeat protein
MTIALRIGVWMAASFMWLMWEPAARADVENGREAGRVHYQRGQAQYELDHYEQAIAEFEAGFAAAPEPAFLFNLAVVHAKLGHKEEALRFYRKYLDHGLPAAEAEQIQEAIHQLERELHPSPAPAAVAPSPIPAPVAEVVIPAAPPPKKRRVWPIAVGVTAAGVAAALIIGLSVGLTRPGEPVINWSAR